MRTLSTRRSPLTVAHPAPLHNQIPQPDRSVDNTTIWAPDFSQELLREPAVLRGARRRLDAQLLHRELVGPVRGQRRR